MTSSQSTGEGENLETYSALMEQKQQINAELEQLSKDYDIMTCPLSVLSRRSKLNDRFLEIHQKLLDRNYRPD